MPVSLWDEIILLRCLKSMQNHREPSGLGTSMEGLYQGLMDSCMTPSDNMACTSLSKVAFMGIVVG